VVAEGDLEVVVFDDAAINALLDASPSLAAEIGEAIEARRQAAVAVRRNAPADS
jgi:hypothetical protein